VWLPTDGLRPDGWDSYPHPWLGQAPMGSARASRADLGAPPKAWLDDAGLNDSGEAPESAREGRL